MQEDYVILTDRKLSYNKK